MKAKYKTDYCIITSNTLHIDILKVRWPTTVTELQKTIGTTTKSPCTAYAQLK